MNTTNVLYISYDGMTDPLGQSQVIPYLAKLASHGFEIHILSAEKPANYKKNEAHVATLLKSHGIEWHPVSYTKHPPVLSTVSDVRRIVRTATRLHRKLNFDLCHCRSYISAFAGLKLKRKFNVPFLFDMRGFYADERVDGRLWDLKNPVFKAVYRYFKTKEKEYLEESDAVISLTHNGKKEMLTWKHVQIPENKISVIPCAADFSHFNIPDTAQRESARDKLGIDKDALVLTYLGSLGTWYLVKEMLAFFNTVYQHYNNAIFLVISRENIFDHIDDAAFDKNAIICRPAKRSEVPYFLSAADIGISFIKPSFSKKSSSPTKMGEMLAMGIPMFVNSNVGDVPEIIKETRGGYVIEQLNKKGFVNAVDKIPELLKISKSEIRNNASEISTLKTGIARYLNIYNKFCRK